MLAVDGNNAHAMFIAHRYKESMDPTSALKGEQRSKAELLIGATEFVIGKKFFHDVHSRSTRKTRIELYDDTNHKHVDCAKDGASDAASDAAFDADSSDDDDDGVCEGNSGRGAVATRAYPRILARHAAYSPVYDLFRRSWEERQAHTRTPGTNPQQSTSQRPLETTTTKSIPPSSAQLDGTRSYERVDIHGVLCRYDVHGDCRDPHCGWQHLDAYTSNSPSSRTTLPPPTVHLADTLRALSERSNGTTAASSQPEADVCIATTPVRIPASKNATEDVHLGNTKSAERRHEGHGNSVWSEKTRVMPVLGLSTTKRSTSKGDTLDDVARFQRYFSSAAAAGAIQGSEDDPTAAEGTRTVSATTSTTSQTIEVPKIGIDVILMCYHKRRMHSTQPKPQNER